MYSSFDTRSSSFDAGTPGGSGAAVALPGVKGSGDGYLLDPRAIDAMVARRVARSALPVLTRREQAILAELATGRSNAAIADRLGLSERTVEKYINALFSKLGLHEDGSWNRRVKAALLFLGADPG